VPTPDTAALAARLREIVSALPAGFQVSAGDGWRFVGADLTAAADALAALAAPSMSVAKPGVTAKFTATPSGNTMIRLGSVTPAPSVAEAREAVEDSVLEYGSVRSTEPHARSRQYEASVKDARRAVEAALDALIAAVRADVPTEVREAAGRVMEFVSLAGVIIRGVRVNDRAVYLQPDDLRALARHGGAT